VTTIFASAPDGVMVSDSKCTSAEVWYPMTKVHRIGKELVGLAGSVKECLAWLEWYKAGKKGVRPKLENFQGLCLRADGLYELGSDGLVQLVERGYHGIGSGGGYAVAASMAGADPKRAVEIACAIDNGSGGDVVVHTLKP
jgi:ATP-dependent protease HslVU (ClpYQ) peptidase subunit